MLRMPATATTAESEQALARDGPDTTLPKPPGGHRMDAVRFDTLTRSLTGAAALPATARGPGRQRPRRARRVARQGRRWRGALPLPPPRQAVQARRSVLLRDLPPRGMPRPPCRHLHVGVEHRPDRRPRRLRHQLQQQRGMPAQPDDRRLPLLCQRGVLASRLHLPPGFRLPRGGSLRGGGRRLQRLRFQRRRTLLRRALPGRVCARTSAEIARAGDG